MVNKKIDWSKIQDWQNENKDLFIMVASPKEDAISFSFGGLGSFVKFPMVDMEKGVVFNALRKSKFEEAVNPLLTAIEEGTGMSGRDLESSEILKDISGAAKAFGEHRSKLSEVKTKKK